MGRVRTITATGINGRTNLLRPELFNATILSVKRGGVGYDIVYTSPVSRQAQVYSYTGIIDAGAIIFQNPFEGNEKIHIIYKT